MTDEEIDLKKCPLCEKLFGEGWICRLARLEGEDCIELSKKFFEGELSIGEYLDKIREKYGDKGVAKLVAVLKYIVEAMEKRGEKSEQ